jgi:hypothetical protein
LTVWSHEVYSTQSGIPQLTEELLMNTWKNLSTAGKLMCGSWGVSLIGAILIGIGTGSVWIGSGAFFLAFANTMIAN